MPDNLIPTAKDSQRHPVKYVLYTHFSMFEDADYKEYEKGVPPVQYKGICFLKEHFRELGELLTTPGHEGLLVLYYAKGFEKYLNASADPENMDLQKERIDLMGFANAVADCVRGILKDENLDDRVRFLISEDLEAVLGKANTELKKQVKRYFVGKEEGIRYDSPKIVEAFIRLRLLGNGVPVLRLDQDVIFGGDNFNIADLGLFKAIECAVRAYRLRLEKPTISNFMFSTSYDSRMLLLPNSEPILTKEGVKVKVTTKDPFVAWSRAFATRIFPAVIADPGLLNGIEDLPEEERGEEWYKYLKEHIDKDLAIQFFGLKPFEEGADKLEPNGTNGLTSIGAHPLYAVISGALLCISEGAILDLPPFSNFGNNVTWIDDHLKFSLHRAMHHFVSNKTDDLEHGLNHSRLDKVAVTKARPKVSDLPYYVFGQYLPTLLWGAIMDTWITTNPILKCRYDELSEADQRAYDKISRDRAPLPDTMLEALRAEEFSDGLKTNLRQKLEDSALVRIQEVRELWANLKKGDNETFASYWAKGMVEHIENADNKKIGFLPKCFKKSRDELWKGITPRNFPPGQRIERTAHLNPAIQLKLKELTEDTINYVEWTLLWPKFVQMVRSVPQGDFMADLKWRPKEVGAYNF